MAQGLKRVARRLADGTVRVHWYHRATNKPLAHDPATAEGLLEVAALDRRAKAVTAVSEAAGGTYAALWTAYRASAAWRDLKPRTRSDYQAVRDWLGAAAEKKPLASLTAPQVERLRDKASLERGRRFGNYVVQVLRLTLAWGGRMGLARENPAAGVKLSRKPRGEGQVNRAWTAAEVEAFLNRCPPQLLAPFALGLFAAMRQGDALKVTWSAYDGAWVRWRASKNGEDCAAPVAGVFRDILEDAKARRDAARAKTRGRPGAVEAVQICVTLEGSSWSESGFRATFFRRLRTLKAAGAIGEGCTFHGLRHTVGAMSRDAGQSDSRVAAAIGDRSTAMAAVYGRDADRASAQGEVLAAVQKRFEKVEWKR